MKHLCLFTGLGCAIWSFLLFVAKNPDAAYFMSLATADLLAFAWLDLREGKP